MIWKRVQALVKVFNGEHSQFLSAFMYYDADLATTCVNEITDNEKLIELQGPDTIIKSTLETDQKDLKQMLKAH
jgi:hypothetical protein